MPLYLAFVFLLHPSLGLMCFSGMLLPLVLLAFMTERLSRNVVQASERADAARKAIADANARNAETRCKRWDSSVAPSTGSRRSSKAT